MDLKSCYPWWLIRNGILADYPALQRDVTCEVAIVGGGITGALIADRLCERGVDVVVIDKRDIGQGSTCASTALLMYELDRPLHKLAKSMGDEAALRVYQLGLQAIATLGKLAGELGSDCGFRSRSCLQFASRAAHARSLRVEYETRMHLGFAMKWLDRKDLQARFGFSKAAAIESLDAAEVDPYRLTHALLQRGRSRGLRVFDRTTVTACRASRRGAILDTDRSVRVRAQRVIMAAGYEAQQHLHHRLTKLRSTYAVVSDPIDEFPGWEDRCLVWETAQPYLYLRTTADNRIIAGGEDTASANPRLRDALLPRKARRLQRKFHALFPEIRYEPAFVWAGVFAESKDGLPYIGPDPRYPRTWFALGYGANGVTFAVMAADIITAEYFGQSHPDAGLFRLDR